MSVISLVIEVFDPLSTGCRYVILTLCRDLDIGVKVKYLVCSDMPSYGASYDVYILLIGQQLLYIYRIM